jgi:hypothetical protein
VPKVETGVEDRDFHAAARDGTVSGHTHEIEAPAVTGRGSDLRRLAVTRGHKGIRLRNARRAFLEH